MTKANFALRLLPSLKAAAERLAAANGTSLDQFINVAVAEKLSALETEEFLRRREAGRRAGHSARFWTVQAPGRCTRSRGAWIDNPVAVASRVHLTSDWEGRSRMHGPEILVRTLSAGRRSDKFGNQWQYHSRSDHHSKVACWGIVFDVLAATPLLRRHVQAGFVCFGINHEMRDFVHDRKKNLDLVLCTPREKPSGQTLADVAPNYGIELSAREQQAFDALPTLRRAPVGSVVMALEAKACMTAHQRALPRLYDELNSSHLTVHGASQEAIAVGFAMVNMAGTYLSPDLNKQNRASAPVWNHHNQPRDAQLVIDKIRQLPRRSKVEEVGYDAISITVIDMANEGGPVNLVTAPPAPQRGDIYEYASMIARLSGLYSTRFKDLA